MKTHFQMTRPGEVITSVGETAAGKARLAALESSRGDIMLLSRKEEGYGVDYDKKTGTFRGHRTLVIAKYERNVKAMAGRVDDHFAEMFKVLAKESADVIKVVDSDTGVVTQYPKEYIQKAYEVFVLGAFRKAAPEVEDLIADTATVQVVK